MKTAMQELIEYVEELYSKDDILEVIVNKANRLLAKEKEQIIDAYNQADLDGYFQKTYPNYAQEYYNKTYNQKTPPCSGHAFETE